MANVVGACICLHNLCTMQKDFGDENLIVEAKKWLLKTNIGSFGDLQHGETMRILDYANHEIDKTQVDVQELVPRAIMMDVNGWEDVSQMNNASIGAFKGDVTMHVELAKSLFN